MRVVHIIENVEPGEGTGPAHSAPALAAELGRQGWPGVVVGCGPWTGPVTVESQVPLLSAKRMLRLRGVEGPDLARLVWVLSRYASLIHVHTIWGTTIITAHTIAALLRKPLVISPRGRLDAWGLAQGSNAKAWFLNSISLPILQRCAFVHALCEEEAASVRQAGIRSPVVIAGNGVTVPQGDDGNWESILRNAFPQIGSRRVVLFLNRLHRQKGIEALLVGWEKTPSRLREGWCLVVAGPDHGAGCWVQDRIEHQEGIKDIVLPGIVRGETKWALLRSAEVFVLPSFSEGMPVSALEAMACGVATAVSPACHLGKAIEAGAAISVEPSVDGVRDALVRLLSVPTKERRVLGERAMEFAKAHFKWEQSAATLAAAYARATSRFY